MATIKEPMLKTHKVDDDLRRFHGIVENEDYLSTAKHHVYSIVLLLFRSGT
jgi:hypothetical protein